MRQRCCCDRPANSPVVRVARNTFRLPTPFSSRIRPSNGSAYLANASAVGLHALQKSALFYSYDENKQKEKNTHVSPLTTIYATRFVLRHFFLTPRISRSGPILYYP